MNQYIGKICPYCKGKFIEEDDIVLCNECDMPHHKSCWVENQGCTTFGCNGTIQSPENTQKNGHQADTDFDFEIELFPSDSDVSTSYCPACGSSHDPADMFCKHCGKRFAEKDNTASYRADNNYTASYYYDTAHEDSKNNTSVEEKYFIQNIGYYKVKFAEMRNQNKHTSWNWAAFFVAPYWCIYRKMYGIGAAVLGGAFILSLLGIIGGVLLFAGYIVFGIYANYLYMQHIQKHIISEYALQEPALTQHRQKYGGTNTLTAILSAIGYGIVVTIITL